MALTSNERGHWERDGYLVLRDVLTPDEQDALLSEADQAGALVTERQRRAVGNDRGDAGRPRDGALEDGRPDVERDNAGAAREERARAMPVPTQRSESFETLT